MSNVVPWQFLFLTSCGQRETPRGTVFLLNCGEGCQQIRSFLFSSRRQMERSSMRAKRPILSFSTGPHVLQFHDDRRSKKLLMNSDCELALRMSSSAS